MPYFVDSSVPTVGVAVRAPNPSLSDFVRELHLDEDALVSMACHGKDLFTELSKFIKRYLTPPGPSEVRPQVLGEHSLLRMLRIQELRVAALDIAPFLDPFEFVDAQVALIGAFGRFVDEDPLVRKFLMSVSSGESEGLIGLNLRAISMARTVLCSSDRNEAQIPSQEESLHMLGLGL
jgi:hypothetical protein